MSEETKNTELALLLEIAQKQEKLAKKALWHQRIRTALILVVVVCMIALAPTALKAASSAKKMLSEAKSMALKADAALEAIEAMDLKNTMDGFDKLVQESTSVMGDSADEIQRSLESVGNIDIEGLNESIKALESSTKALSRTFGR